MLTNSIFVQNNRPCHLPNKNAASSRWLIDWEYILSLDLPSISASAYKNPHRQAKLHNCQETIKIQPGCEIVDRKCECWHQTITLCKENLVRWDFANIEVRLIEGRRRNFSPLLLIYYDEHFSPFLFKECELNLANLHQSEVEFDEDYTIPPTNIGN